MQVFQVVSIWTDFEMILHFLQVEGFISNWFQTHTHLNKLQLLSWTMLKQNSSWPWVIFQHVHYFIPTKVPLMNLIAYNIQDDIVNPIDMVARDPLFCPSIVSNFIVWTCVVWILSNYNIIHETFYHWLCILNMVHPTKFWFWHEFIPYQKHIHVQCQCKKSSIIFSKLITIN